MRRGGGLAKNALCATRRWEEKHRNAHKMGMPHSGKGDTLRSRATANIPFCRVVLSTIVENEGVTPEAAAEPKNG